MTMNSVTSLITEPFLNRSDSDKLEIVGLGRPTPYLTIVQRVSTKKRSFSRIFNPSMYKKYNWICGCEVKNALFCFPCLLFGGEPLWTQTGHTDLNHSGDRIKKHTLSPRHLKNILQLSLFGEKNVLDSTYVRNIKLHNEQVQQNRYVLNAMIDSIRFSRFLEWLNEESTLVGKSEMLNLSSEIEIALNTYFEKAPIFKGASKTIQSEILQCMSHVCREEISKEMKQAEYLSIIAEETSDTANIFEIAIVFRYVINGMIVEHFCDFLTPVNHYVQSLSNVIIAALDKHIKVGKNKLMAQTYNLIGWTNGIQANVKKIYKNAAYVHCYAHQLNLVMLNTVSVNKNVRLFCSNLRNILNFIATTSRRTPTFKVIINKISPTLTSAKLHLDSEDIYALCEHREAIIEELQRVVNEDRRFDIVNQALGHILVLKSKHFEFWLDFFSKIMPHVDLLSINFQSSEINGPLVSEHISSFASQLTQIKDNITASSDSSDQEPPVSKRPKTNEPFESIEDVREVCDIIISEAKQRFAFTGHLTAASLFFPEYYSQYNASFPVETLEQTIKTYPFLDGQKLQMELSVIYDTKQFKSISSILSLYDVISKNKDIQEAFNETLKLLKILLVIPVTDEQGRGFSTLKQLKSFLKNTVEDETVSALMMLSKERKLMENTVNFNQMVIDKFAAEKHRVGDFLLK